MSRVPPYLLALALAACGGAPSPPAGADADADATEADTEAPPVDLCAEVDCPEPLDTCLSNVCDPATGACQTEAWPVGTPCEGDGLPCTEEACGPAGLCDLVADLCDGGDDTGAPDEPPAGACDEAVPVTCGEVVGPLDGTVQALPDYPGCDVPAAPGAEAIFVHTPTTDGVLRVTVVAEPAAYASVQALLGACDPSACAATAPVGAQPLLVPVTADEPTYLIVDATVGGVLELDSLWLECGTAEACASGVDEDLDGLVDCADPDCAAAGPPCEPEEATCDDGADNDGDGAADCDDPGCLGLAGCEAEEVTCDDGADNDADGATDCDDVACSESPACLVDCASTAVPIACGETLGTLQAADQAALSHPCVAGATTWPDLTLAFSPDTAGTASLALEVHVEGVVVLAYGGACDAEACELLGSPEPFHHQTVGALPFEAGDAWFLVVDALEAPGVTPGPLTIGSIALTCD